MLIVLAMPPAFAAPATPGEETDLKRRVQLLEQQNDDLKKSYDSFVTSVTKTIKEGALAQDSAIDLEQQIHSKLQASGYADVEFRNSSTAGESPGFRIHHFSLILTKQINPQWRSFAEIEYEDAPRVEFKRGSPNCQGECSGQIFLEAMNVDYSPSDTFGVRFGRFFTPTGIWSIDHYPPFVPTQERPLHINNIFPQLVDGILLHGTLPYKEMFFKYDGYAGNGESSSGHSDDNDRKSLGLRAAANLPWLSDFEFGTSLYTDTLTVANQPVTKKFATGLHAKTRWGRVVLQTELANASYDPRAGAKYNTSGYYAQLGYDISAATTLGYRYDVFKDKNENAKRNSLFANYRAHKNVVLKLEHHRTTHDGMHRDILTIASLAVYLGE
jgi:hypothetical protein